MLTLPAGRRSKYVVLFVALVFFIGLASQAGKFEGVQKNESSSFLPGDAESVKALEAIQQLPGGELAPAVIVFEREGGLTEADRQRVDETRTKLNENRPELVLEAQEPVFSKDGAAALIVQPVQPGGGAGWARAAAEGRVSAAAQASAAALRRLGRVMGLLGPDVEADMSGGGFLSNNVLLSRRRGQSERADAPFEPAPYAIRALNTD
jgi:hypothetical protein